MNFALRAVACTAARQPDQPEMGFRAEGEEPVARHMTRHRCLAARRVGRATSLGCGCTAVAVL